MWGDYLDTHLQYAFVHEPKVAPLGTTEKEAEDQLKLVLSGKKRALTHSLVGLQSRNEPLPRIGDFRVLTDWNGKARCIIRTVAVRLVPWFAVRSSYARTPMNRWRIGRKAIGNILPVSWNRMAGYPGRV